MGDVAILRFSFALFRSNKSNRDCATSNGPTSLDLYWERCRRGEIMRDTTDLKGAMALGLDVSRTDDVAVVRCRGRIVFGEEADELRRVVLGLLNETQRIVLNLLWIEDIDSSGLGTLVASLNRTLCWGQEKSGSDLGPVSGVKGFLRGLRTGCQSQRSGCILD